MRRSSIDPTLRPSTRWPTTSRPHLRFGARIGTVALLALSGCAAPNGSEVAIVGLEDTTYVNGSVTFEIAVVGAPVDSLELRRDGALFQVLTGDTYTWDSTAAPEGSYSFVARARRGATVIDSEPKVIVVDRTPATVALSVTASADPIVLPAGDIELTADTADVNGVPRVEFLDGDEVVGASESEPFGLTLPAVRGIHTYRARVVDRAGNTTLSTATEVPVYVRETLTLASEPALDGCVVAGYEPAIYERHFDVVSCTYVTSYPILHFYSFDRSPWPGALVEEATLRFHLQDAYGPSAYLASVTYDESADAPPTAFAWPFEPEVPEVVMPLATTGSGPSKEQLDVTAQTQADVAAGRPRSQFRLRNQYNGPGGLGGTAYYAEVGDDRAPELELVALVP